MAGEIRGCFNSHFHNATIVHVSPLAVTFTTLRIRLGPFPEASMAYRRLSKFHLVRFQSI
jgi:hypothetical protein